MRSLYDNLIDVEQTNTMINDRLACLVWRSAKEEGLRTRQDLEQMYGYSAEYNGAVDGNMRLDSIATLLVRSGKYNNEKRSRPVAWPACPNPRFNLRAQEHVSRRGVSIKCGSRVRLGSRKQQSS